MTPVHFAASRQHFKLLVPLLLESVLDHSATREKKPSRAEAKPDDDNKEGGGEDDDHDHDPYYIEGDSPRTMCPDKARFDAAVAEAQRRRAVVVMLGEQQRDVRSFLSWLPRDVVVHCLYNLIRWGWVRDGDDF